ncbi:glycosyltransferase family 39 protein [Dysgonomonas sp. 216]|uniref:ArnT family glycosyltransferase n=1 Tax=Dysgonomonas sp. 216 TaxID=2302934 RepID=UPI0013D28D8C|nr:glycosyltransferase family 39 protein [Dysgonomonas sp. 216]
MEKKKIIVSSDKIIILLLLVFSVFFLFLNSKNSPLYLFNEWCDPNIYFSIGKGMINGLIPYKDLFDHKGPFIFLIYAIAYLISPNSFLGVYIIECITLFISLIFVYKIARLYLNDTFSFATALIYTVFLFTKSHYGGSAEEFISVSIIVSFYYFILYFRDNDLPDKKYRNQMFIHGLMFGLAFLSKLSICVFWVPLLLVIGINLLFKKEYIKALIYSLIFLLGFIVFILPFILYFSLNSALYDAYFGYIEFNSMYAEFNPDIWLLRKIVVQFIKLMINDFISFPILVLGVCMLSFTKRYIKNKLYKFGILASFALSFIFICLSKYIMTYAHMVIYAYSVFGLIFIFQIIDKIIDYKKYNLYICIAVFVGTLVIGTNDKKLFNEDINCLTRKTECTYMQKKFTQIINKEKNPTLLNIGLDFGVFTKSGIVPTYKYFFYPNIPYHIYPEIRDYQVNLIETKDPMFIVIGEYSSYFEVYNDLPALHKNYELISTYNPDSTDIGKQVFLYKRKH